jgi:hypothetical protein
LIITHYVHQCLQCDSLNLSKLKFSIGLECEFSNSIIKCKIQLLSGEHYYELVHKSTREIIFTVSIGSMNCVTAFVRDTFKNFNSLNLIGSTSQTG